MVPWRGKIGDFLDNVGTSFQSGLENHHSVLGTPVSSVAEGIGATLSDAVTDGTRKFVWFYNHPLASGTATGTWLGSQPGVRSGHERIGGALMSLGIIPLATGNFNLGNADEFGRREGYKAVLPSEEDGRKTSNPIGEVLSRYFLGRSGRLLPYEKAKMEIPGLTKEQYDAVSFSQSPENNRLFGFEQSPLIGAVTGAGIGGGVRALMSAPGNTMTVKPHRKSDDLKSQYWAEVPVPIGGRRRKVLTSAGIGAAIGSMLPLLADVGAVREVDTLQDGKAVQMLGYQIPLQSLLPIGLAGAGIWAGARAIGKRNLARLQQDGSVW